MQETKDCLLNRLIAELSCGPDLARKQRIAAPIFERPQVLAVRLLGDTEEARTSPPFSPRRLARTTIDRLRSDRRPS